MTAQACLAWVSSLSLLNRDWPIVLSEERTLIQSELEPGRRKHGEQQNTGHSWCPKRYSVGDWIGKPRLPGFLFPSSSLVLIKYISCALVIAKQALSAQAKTISSELMMTGEFYQGAGQEEAKAGQGRDLRSPGLMEVYSFSSP